ncbi:MAG: diacylglycerol kinase family protein [Rubripirellula sp.]|nr:diacylglycerol kinase family protein [Rubripirellula sp.]
MDRNDPSKSYRVLIFTSPKAGSGASREQIPRLESLLEELGIEVHVVHEVARLRQLVSDCEQPQRELTTIVVAAGGDGTLSLACATLFLSPKQLNSSVKEENNFGNTMVMPMPLGTENLLARHFGHVADADSVLDTIEHGQSFELDAGLANGKPFLVMATCGFDAEVVREMHQRRQGHISRFSYFVPMLNALLRYRFPKLCLTVDGTEVGKCCWVMSFNLPRYGGGLNIEPDALGDDGLLDVIAFERGSIASGLNYVAGIWSGRHLDAEDVIRLRGQTIRVESKKDVAYQLDGDYGGQLPLEIETLPGCVPLLIPGSKGQPAPDGLPSASG